ncbi:MAG TPA: zinc ribbon domain-containing protein, partial [Candidatus Bathyarchaeia archaeon]|nr:zinc ribbon domain-containing protein [Candidatus Bathyarchaeia archaeon]
DALHAAIENYRSKKQAQPAAAQAEAADSESKTCPFCDAELGMGADPICQSCQIEFEDCPACGKLASNSDKYCPHCGAELKKE